MRALLVEDDVPLAEFLSQRLRDDQFVVDVANDGTQAKQLLDDQPFDLVILDLNLPGIPGFEVLRYIRLKKADLPVLVLTGAASVEDRVRGLNAGADDYLVKPFSYAELLARIGALLRRGGAPMRPVLKVGDLELNRIERTVQRGGRSIELTPKEFSLLEFLMQNVGLHVTRNMIVEQVWKLSGDTMTNVVDVYINYLRRKIDTDSDTPLIRTIRGIGYQIGGTE
jgi:DNA-binding response OmpR family regulator